MVTSSLNTDSDSQFTDDERAQLAALEAAEAGEDVGDSLQSPPAPPAPAAAPAATAPTPPAAPATALAPTTTATPVDDRPPGELRAALRASRHAERQAERLAEQERRRAESLQAELDRLRAGAPAAAPAADEFNEETAAAIAEDYQPLAPLLKQVVKLTKAQAAPAPAPAAAPAAAPAPAEEQQPDFRPPRLPEAVQEAVDGIPQLLAWQHDPDQTAWRLVVAQDAMLQSLPKWKNSPIADPERFQEAVRRVQRELAEAGIVQQPQAQAPAAPAETAAQRAARIVAATGVNKPEPATIGDLGGGSGDKTPTYVDYARMSDEEILGSLPG